MSASSLVPLRNTPRVSVVLPVMNGAAYLAKSLDSVLAQNFEDFELVAVDDGSTDGTAAILQAYQARDPRIRVICQAHAGLVAALRCGCDAARGEFIARLDADDMAQPWRLQRQVAYLDAFPDIALVGSAVTYIDDNGRRVGRSRFPRTPARIARYLFAGDNVLAHSTVMMRRTALVAAGHYDAFYLHAEDYALWLRMAETSAMANLAEPLVQYRLHHHGTGSRNRLDQIIAARTAVVVARLRRLGQPDPTTGYDRPSIALFAALPFTAAERRATMRDIGWLALGMMHDGVTAADRVEAVAATLSPTGGRRTLPEIVAAMVTGAAGGPFADPRIAECMAAFGLHLARRGRMGAGLSWLLRAASRHPLGPAWLCYRVAHRVVMRYAGPRHSIGETMDKG